MRKFGIKLWSMDFIKNPEFVVSVEAALKEGLFGYLELFALPDTFDLVQDKVEQFRCFNSIIHAPHSRQNMNLSEPDAFLNNVHLLEDSKRFADVLDAPYIILHPGYGGKNAIEENIRQFKAFNESRLIVENLPFTCSSTNKNLEGVTPLDIKKIIDEVQCGFCLDFSHAICGANYYKRDIYEVLNEFKELNPVMYHLCDGDLGSEFDAHLHYGEGNYDLKRLVLDYTTQDALITMETGKGLPSSVAPWLDDLKYIENLTKL